MKWLLMTSSGSLKLGFYFFCGDLCLSKRSFLLQETSYEVSFFFLKFLDFISVLLRGQRVLENSIYLRKSKNMAISAAWMLCSGSQCFQQNFKNPAIEYWVDNVRKIYHQISYVISSAKSKRSLKIEFFPNHVKNLQIFRTFGWSKRDAIVIIVKCGTYLIKF